MNKHELIDIMANSANISKAAAESALNAFLDTVMGTLKEGGKVSIIGFGNWETSHRAARTGRNPQTGEVIQIPEAVIPKFKAGKKFKDMVNAE